MQLMGGNWPHDGGTHSSTSAVAGKGKDLPPLHTIRLHTQGMRNKYWCHLNTIPPRKGGQWERTQSKGRPLSAKHTEEHSGMAMACDHPASVKQGFGISESNRRGFPKPHVGLNVT